MKTYQLMPRSVLVVLMLQIGLSWAQSPKYGGTLRIALSGEPAFFNANQGPAPGAPAFFISNSLYNSLLTLTPPPELKIGLLSRDRKSSEQFTGFNCRDHEIKAELALSGIVPSMMSNANQEETL